MREELKPCPFCGCKMRLHYDQTSEYFGPDGEHEKGCLIGAIDFVDYADKAHALREWNTRSTPPQEERSDPLGLAAADDNHKALVEALLAADHAITGIELARIRGADDGREGVRLAKLVVNLKAAAQNLAAAFQSRQEEKQP